jgi:3-oxoacyl-[acyl-carrier-protein] synthase-3
LGVPAEKVPVVLQETGNTGPSSIPLALTLLAENTPAAQWRRTLLCGFGIGLSWGAVTADLSHTHFLPLLELP